MADDIVQRETIGSVAILKLNAPDKFNILSQDLIATLNHQLDVAEADEHVRVIILTGSGKAFSAGANVSEIKDFSANEAATQDFIAPWEHILTIMKPIIAAINGYAFGGGCELAMMCDIRIAATTALFGQPEIKLGTIPGAGGTQRLTQAIGQSRTMEMCLTGKIMSAAEALQYGLVSSIAEPFELLPQAQAMAEEISKFSQPVVKTIKHLIRSVEQHALNKGIKMERQTFYQTFDLEDQKEGIAAFLDKRTPKFKDK